jgi:hypothetical protein
MRPNAVSLVLWKQPLSPRLFIKASTAKLTLEQWRQQTAEAEAALEALISAIRHEFRLPEFPIRLRVDPSLAADAEETGARTAFA